MRRYPNDGGLLATPADWARRREQVLAHVQTVMGELPSYDRSPPEVDVEDTVSAATYVRMRLTFRSQPGDRVPAWLLTPSGYPGHRPVALCLHPTSEAGKDEPLGLGLRQPPLPYATELAERGYLAIVPDYPGSGDYHVDPYAMGYASASMKAVWNNLRALDYACSISNADPGRVAAIGHSLGGHNAIFTALFDRRIRAVVSSCGFTSFARYAGGDLSGWSHRGYMPRIASEYGAEPARMPFDFPDLIAALAPAALFASAPVDDDNFAVAGVRECVEYASPIYRLLGCPERLLARYPDAGHDFPADARTEAYQFLDGMLGVNTGG